MSNVYGNIHPFYEKGHCVHYIPLFPNTLRSITPYPAPDPLGLIIRLNSFGARAATCLYLQ